MSLSCYCSEWDGDGWFYIPADDYAPLATKRWRKCCSCKALIRPGELALKFKRFRSPESDIEERIHGDEVPMTKWYACEECSDMYFNLTELGFCINLPDNFRKLVREYADMLKGKA